MSSGAQTGRAVEFPVLYRPGGATTKRYHRLTTDANGEHVPACKIGDEYGPDRWVRADSFTELPVSAVECRFCSGEAQRNAGTAAVESCPLCGDSIGDSSLPDHLPKCPDR